MSLFKLLADSIEAENKKKADLFNKAEKENPLALTHFIEKVCATLESKLAASQNFPNFSISFSSEELNGELMKMVVLDILEFCLEREGVKHHVPPTVEVVYYRGYLREDPSYTVKISGKLTTSIWYPSWTPTILQREEALQNRRFVLRGEK
jgi:hypothetical protein